MKENEVDKLKSYIKHDDLSNLEEFLKNLSDDEIHNLSFEGWDVFNFACYHSSIQIVSAILHKELPLKFNGVTKYGYNGLHNAVLSSINLRNDKQELQSNVSHDDVLKNREVIKILIEEAGFDPNSKAFPAETDRSDLVNTPMNLYMQADGIMDPDSVRLMLRAGGDPNTKCLGNNGAPIIAKAAEFLEVEIVKNLLEFGAKLNFTDKDDNTIVHFALSGIPSDKSSNKLCAEMIVLLISAGALFCESNNVGKTPIELVAENTQSTAVQYISKFTKDSEKGRELLEITAELGYGNIVEYVKSLPKLKLKALEEKELFRKKIAEKLVTLQCDDQLGVKFSDLNDRLSGELDCSNEPLVEEVILKGADTKCCKIKDRFNNTCKAITAILVIILLFTSISGISLFAVQYRSNKIPTILIVCSFVLASFLGMFVALNLRYAQSGEKVSGQEEHDEEMNTTISEVETSSEGLVDKTDALAR